VKKQKNNKITKNLPPIPNKLFFSIGEAAELCGVDPHVLRYWEAEFPKLQPAKHRGGRRNYKPKDIELVRSIRYLLYDEGFTIAGAKKQLKSGNKIEPKAENDEILLPIKQSLEQFTAQMITDLEDLLDTADG